MSSMPSRFFVSDNAAAVHPDVLAAIAAANDGHAVAYGHDRWTRDATESLRRHFGEHAAVLLLFGGTGANVVALRSAVDSHQAVLCADVAHLYCDECAAPERFVGCKLIPLATRHGKLSAETVERGLWKPRDVHQAPPRLLSLTQPTERGTLYTRAELQELAELAHRHDLLVHVDGARLPQAAAALETDLRSLITDVGVDLLSLGGTKCGLLGGEAVVLLRAELQERAPFYRMQCTQLPSKMRFVAAQMEALYGGELWLELARHANAMARRLAERIEGVVEPVHPVQTNALFVRLEEEVIAPLQERFPFGRWPGEPGLVRWMTAWDTTPEDVDAFAGAIRELHDSS